MSKKDLSPEDAAKLPRIFYSPAEIAAMTGIEYEGVLAAIKAGEIPGERVGIRYYVPAWWVTKHLSGAADATQADELAERRMA
jgi:hypothetical protein